MKKRLSVVLVFISTFVLSSFKPAGHSGRSFDDTKVEVVFNRHLDFADVAKIKLDLSEKGIVIKYKTLVFDEEGNLKSISFFVDCRDGFSGSASEGNLTNQSRVGFYRDYSKDAESPFGAGNI